MQEEELLDDLLTEDDESNKTEEPTARKVDI
jgi:hypothetical protein